VEDAVLEQQRVAGVEAQVADLDALRVGLAAADDERLLAKARAGVSPAS